MSKKELLEIFHLIRDGGVNQQTHAKKRLLSAFDARREADARAVLQGLFAHYGLDQNPEDSARYAYEYADAMRDASKAEGRDT